MTKKHILPDKAGTWSFIKDTADRPHGPCAKQADPRGETWAAPVSVLSTAELRQIVMQILG